MAFKAKAFAGSHCGCRYQQDYRPTLGRDGKKESGTLEVIKFYYDGAIRMEQHCYGEAATFVFGVWASGMDPDGTTGTCPTAARATTMRTICPKSWTGWMRQATSILTARRSRGSWRTILPRIRAGATPAGKWCWASCWAKAKPNKTARRGPHFLHRPEKLGRKCRNFCNSY